MFLYTACLMMSVGCCSQCGGMTESSLGQKREEGRKSVLRAWGVRDRYFRQCSSSTVYVFIYIYNTMVEVTCLVYSAPT